MEDLIGRTLGHYRIVEKIGEGGMGEVYRARDTRLGRMVAIKVLPSQLASDPERLRRLEREARAASALNHPNIVTVYDIGEQDGVRFVAMELVEGRTLRDVLGAGPLPVDRLLRLAKQMADGLAKAHAAGIAHRDLKPENVMVTGDGLVKIVDFGLAKRVLAGTAFPEATTASAITLQGVITGTVGYLSPEQIAGRPADERSDEFSFGVVVYELVCGRRPFGGDSSAAVLAAIVRDTPAAPHGLRPDVPKDLDAIVMRCLEKDPARRYPSMADVARSIGRCQERMAAAAASRGLFRRPAVAALAVALVAALSVAGWLWVRSADERWVRRALPEITRLTDEGRIYDAYRLALEASHRVSDDPALRELINRITLPLSVVTTPPGAVVEVKGYETSDEPWQRLGETPLDVRVPYALMRWKITKAGFETFEGAPFGDRPFEWLGSGLPLQAGGSAPAGMVWIPGGYIVNGTAVTMPPVTLEDYWLDRLEVTNRQYQAFVDQGGYARRELWTEPFEDEGRTLPWQDAMARFRDATGRPGPSGWELGAFPAGHDDDPVGGVSWYEAAAYCAFVGGRLPTVFHWANATHQEQISGIVLRSNFASDGPVPVGSLGGIGDFGTYDMAGNVKEWCWNPTPAGGDKRYILGGGWSEPTYQFLAPDAQRQWDRLPVYGVRCARYADPEDVTVLRPVDLAEALPPQKPIGDDVFEAYRDLYAYQRTALEAKVERVDESPPYWRRETVSFTAAYGGERVTAILFLPRNAAPPYQAVIWLPGDDAYAQPSSDALAGAYLFDFIPRSGRALVYPIYKGLYERRLPPAGEFPLRDSVPLWYKDFARTLDYLETRADFDRDRVAYYGFSDMTGPIFAALEPRIKALVMLSGGRPFWPVRPYVDVANFAPRTRTPTLMINGRDDFILPAATLQKQLFDLLGAPEADKRHVLLEGGHVPPDRHAIIREVLAWLDKYLGTVTPLGQMAETAPANQPR